MIYILIFIIEILSSYCDQEGANWCSRNRTSLNICTQKIKVTSHCLEGQRCQLNNNNKTTCIKNVLELKCKINQSKCDLSFRGILTCNSESWNYKACKSGNKCEYINNQPTCIQDLSRMECQPGEKRCDSDGYYSLSCNHKSEWEISGCGGLNKCIQLKNGYKCIKNNEKLKIIKNKNNTKKSNFYSKNHFCKNKAHLAAHCLKQECIENERKCLQDKSGYYICENGKNKIIKCTENQNCYQFDDGLTDCVSISPDLILPPPDPIPITDPLPISDHFCDFGSKKCGSSDLFICDQNGYWKATECNEGKKCVDSDDGASCVMSL